MLFMQPSLYPKKPYTQHVSLTKMHKFTLLQLGLFAVLYVVKTIKSIALAFPIIIAICIPIRVFWLPKMFSKADLVFLDGDDTEIDAALKAKKKEMPPPLAVEASASEYHTKRAPESP